MSAWSSRTAQGVLRTAQGVICYEMIVDDDAVSHGSGHFAALLADAVVRVYGGGGAVKPARLAAYAKAGLVQVTYLGGHDAHRDMRQHRCLRLGGFAYLGDTLAGQRRG